MSYADIYEQEERNRSLVDYAKDPSELTTDKGTFRNFLEVAKLNAEETFKTNSIIAEQFNEREYNIENDKKIKDIISNEEYYSVYSRYKNVDYERYSQIKSDLETGTYQNNKDEDYIKDLKAVKYIEGIMNDNPELKLMTKEDRRKNVIQEIERLRNNKAIRTSQQESIVGEFAGSVAGMLADPVNFATLFIPIAGQARNASLLIRSLETGAKTALMEGSIEAFNQFTAVVPYRRDYLGDNYTFDDAVGAVTTTAFGSFILGGGLQAFGDIGAAFLKERNKGVTQKLIEENEKKRVEQPDKVTASEIEAAENLKVIENQTSKSLTGVEFEEANMKSFQKATYELATGKKVDIEDISNPLRKEQFKKVIDNVLESKNLNDIKRRWGSQLTDYIKKNGEDIKNRLETKTVREVFNELQEEFNNKLVFDKPRVKVKTKIEDQDLKQNKSLAIMKKQNKFSEETVSNIELTLSDINNKMNYNDKSKEAVALKQNLDEIKAEFTKSRKEQEAMLDFQACLLKGE